jgi:hypothetical protein
LFTAESKPNSSPPRNSSDIGSYGETSFPILLPSIVKLTCVRRRPIVMIAIQNLRCHFDELRQNFHCCVHAKKK